MNGFAAIAVAREEDAAEIACLAAELGYPVAVDVLRANLAAMLASPRHLILVVPAGDGNLLGWIGVERRLSLESGEAIEISGLVVGLAARRLGVGRALVAAAEAWAMEQGFASIRVRSNVARAESRSFYRSLGFRLRKSQHVYDKEIFAPAEAGG